jgi:hypothetical protein
MNIEHIKDYDSTIKHLGNLNELENLPQTKRTSCANSRLSITMETTEKWWVNDLDCPYTEDKR